MISRKENSCAALIEYQSNNHQKSFHPLKASDLDRLIQNQWIIDDVIKADILLMNQPKTYIIEPHAVDQILIKRKRTFTRNNFSKHEFLVGTLNQNNHWSLMFADLNRRLFFYLDPFVAKSSIVSKFFDSWKHFLQSREDLPKDNWRLGDFVHTKQSDNFNCGIIVLMMIRKLFDKESSLVFDKSMLFDYRLDLYDRICENSLEFGRFCVCCSKPFEAMSSVISCTNCNKTYHFSCVSHTQKHTNFVCFLCD